MTIRERIKNGMLYVDIGEGLDEEREKCKELLYDYNHTRPSEKIKRKDFLKELLGDMGDEIWIEPPLHMAYGKNVHIGNCFYANFNLVIVDDIDVYIGEHVMIAPNVTITPTGHPVDPDLRKPGTQFSIPVKIGNNVWIGSNAVILPGVTIGDNSVIGAGSVVTHDIPENVIAVGNPCRVLRKISEHDKEFYFKNKRVE
ncbi:MULTISPECIES: maltose acetyltransferase domain-containing protein [unclassified Clostridium]|uniref:maltose acetyltransferase domain-containing protein n=1 Tax=unclassified Clostridium TaxID=2614128 RepID=UPI001EECE8CC|nr:MULTISPECIES: maltose acetyltransferase domain-containing protein [unclassified Clostridium]